MPLVTCIGSAVQDTVFSIDGALEVGGKNLASDLRHMGGGPAANAAVAVASLGGNANLVAVVGNDTTGDEIIEQLESRGVSTNRVRRNHGVSSPQSVVITDDQGERTIVNRTDKNLWLDVPLISSSDIEGSASVLADLRWLDGAVSGIKEASEVGIPIVVDYDLTDATPPDSVLDLASHVIFSEPALERLTGLPDPRIGIEAIETGSGFAGVTLGASGVLWREDGRTHHLNAFDIVATGTLGAGDVFHGAFALGLTQGRETFDNMRWSAACAALTCAKGGGRQGIPTGSEVMQFLKEIGE